MRSLSALLTPSALATSGATVTKTLAFVASERIWHEYSDILSKPSDGELIRQGGGVERQDEEVGITTLTISERSDASDVGHPITPQISHDFIFGHVAKFGSEYCSFAGVATTMESDGDSFPTENCSLEKGLGVSSGVRFKD